VKVSYLTDAFAGENADGVEGETEVARGVTVCGDPAEKTVLHLALAFVDGTVDRDDECVFSFHLSISVWAY
jgi:hypothetical protein